MWPGFLLFSGRVIQNCCTVQMLWWDIENWIFLEQNKVECQKNKKKITLTLTYKKNHLEEKNTCCWLQGNLGIIRFVCRWSTWLKHLLHQVEADTRFALVLGHGEVVEQVKMSHVWAVRVSVLVDQPFPFAGVSVSCADVLRLKMLQLTVDVISVRHPRWESLKLWR